MHFEQSTAPTLKPECTALHKEIILTPSIKINNLTMEVYTSPTYNETLKLKLIKDHNISLDEIQLESLRENYLSTEHIQRLGTSIHQIDKQIQ